MEAIVNGEDCRGELCDVNRCCSSNPDAPYCLYRNSCLDPTTTGGVGESKPCDCNVLLIYYAELVSWGVDLEQGCCDSSGEADECLEYLQLVTGEISFSPADVASGSGETPAVAVPDEGVGAWSFLPVTLPASLSDMSVASFTVAEGLKAGGNRIMLTGGCMEYMEYNELFGFGVFVCPSLTNKAYAFDPIRSDSKTWTGEFEQLADMPRARSRHASAFVNGRVCVFGGRDATDNLISEVDCYDPQNNEWSTLSTPIPAEYLMSDNAAFSTKDDKVCGYNPNYDALNLVIIVDMSDMDNILFSLGANAISNRGDIGMAAVNGDIYVAGGWTHENNFETPLNSVERFNVATGAWSTVDSLNVGRGDHQLVALNGKLYAIGGENKVDIISEEQSPELGEQSLVLDSVEMLDLENPQSVLAPWKSLPSMPVKLFRFAASGLEISDEEGIIFIFGGQIPYDGDCECFRATNKVMVFDARREISTAPLTPPMTPALPAFPSSSLISPAFPTASPAPSTNRNFCGVSQEDAQNNCAMVIPCPDGLNSTCLQRQYCFQITEPCDSTGSVTYNSDSTAFSPSWSPITSPPTHSPTDHPSKTLISYRNASSFCGTDYYDALNNCYKNRVCPLGDEECPSGQICFPEMPNCNTPSPTMSSSPTNGVSTKSPSTSPITASPTTEPTDTPTEEFVFTY
mmetsp:Transcript_42648/g.89499  ORF Transcript_42648/g.89499 Transcript_42648/m.89499 type:complete len:686 (+) Transcript_42648:2184-4241(+)